MLNVVKYPSTSIPFAIAQDDKLLNKKALHLRGFQYFLVILNGVKQLAIRSFVPQDDMCQL
jgi:hypothetical protein